MLSMEAPKHALVALKRLRPKSEHRCMICSVWDANNRHLAASSVPFPGMLLSPIRRPALAGGLWGACGSF